VTDSDVPDGALRATQRSPHLMVADLAPEVVDIEEHAHHLLRVLRLRDGAPLSLTDGRGGRADAVLHVPAGGSPAGSGRGSATATARRVAPVEHRPQPRPRLTLVQAVAKGRRVEEAVRLACELGVDRLVPVVAARTQGRPDAGARAAVRARWTAVAVAALEQSRGVHLATVAPVIDLAALGSPAEVGRTGTPSVDLPADTPPPDTDVVGLVLVPGAASLPTVLAGRASEAAPHAIALVGPEGGLEDQEVAGLVARGWLSAGLGPTVLRTEHAGPVALAVLAASTGRWHGDR
jgi:16S rRNA (uracil1498-N3)-methyltransferase